MITTPNPQDFEILAVKAHVTMAEVCRRAGLTPAVFHRWKAGKSSPSIANIEKLRTVLHDLVNAND